MWSVHNKCQNAIDGLNREVAISASECERLRVSSEELSEKAARLAERVAEAVAIAERANAVLESTRRELLEARTTLSAVAACADGNSIQILEVLAAYSSDLVSDAKLPTMTFTAISPRISSDFPRFQQKFSSPEARKLFPTTELSIDAASMGGVLSGTMKCRCTFQEACAVIQVLTLRITGRDRANVMNMDPGTRNFTFFVV